jgi:hypothetical protein
MPSTLSDRGMGEFCSLRDTLKLSTDLQRNSDPNATLKTTGLRKPSLIEPSRPSPSVKNVRTQATAPSQRSRSPSSLPTPCSKTAPASTSKNGRPRAETSRLPKTSGMKSSRAHRANKNRSSSSSASPLKGATGLLKLKLVSCRTHQLSQLRPLSHLIDFDNS